ncbi:prolyl oligopeptidase family serine peptidase [uncultured Roseivirga sp.]|uniref:prolyl oligopeptidase family serine peptidase n=1 Tax=uncultured Roseivirga sp. TaxID=543088 RepID=UPI000D7B6D17|nr:prolyl oligopeptidase family serine peptidase [uncultured Roseivirga sp.]PWL28336.1 MAG: hypothetical protein DCO95_13235 [Roseivirga sp. XM-24bin3]
MLKQTFTFFAFLICFSANLRSQTYSYPVAPKDSIFDKYFDTLIYDPYQWMENPNDSRLSEWLSEQKKITDKEGRQQTYKRTLQAQIGSIYYDVKEKSTESFKQLIEKERVEKFQFKFEAKESFRSADLLYKRGNETNWKYLIKARDLQETKDEFVSVDDYYLNEEESLVAVTVSVNGSDWRKAYVFNLLTGEMLPENLQFLRMSSNIVWNGRSFFYDRYSAPAEGRELLDKATGQALYVHHINQSQEKDELIYINPDRTGTNSFNFFEANDDVLIMNHFGYRSGKAFKAISYIRKGSNSGFSLNNFLAIPNDQSTFTIEEVIGSQAIIRTTLGAPNGKVLVADINQVNQLGELVPQFDANLREINQIDTDKIACIYRQDDQFLALIYNLKGELLKTINVPKGKKINGPFKPNTDTNYTLFNISSFYHPDLWYKLDLETLEFVPIEEITVPYKVNDIETRYVKFQSKDGTEVPMYITCSKETKLDGKNPTLVYGYGGYGITVEPGYDESLALFLAHGGVLAMPNVRGGGAEGDSWALEGRRLKKQNAIDDFISASEYLIEKGYTSSGRMAINGGSHGGMLVLAAMVQRPELFKAVIAEAAPTDMLRKSLFTTAGTSINLLEYGSAEYAEDFENLISYSPLHNIKEGVEYPNLLLMTGETDDRVVPHHTYKFLATIQEKASNESLYHVYVTPKSGHGGELTRNDFTDKILFKYYFIFDQLGIKL